MTALSIHLLSANWLIPIIAASQGVTCNDEEYNNPIWHQSFLQPGVGATLQGAFSLSFFAFPHGILVPWPGINPTSPALEAWSLNHWTAREVPTKGPLDSAQQGFFPAWRGRTISTALHSTHACKVTSVVSDSATPWTVAHQTPLSMGFSRQEHWSGLPFPIPGDLPSQGMEPESPVSPALASGFLTTSATWEAQGTLKLAL